MWGIGGRGAALGGGKGGGVDDGIGASGALAWAGAGVAEKEALGGLMASSPAYAYGNAEKCRSAGTAPELTTVLANTQ